MEEVLLGLTILPPDTGACEMFKRNDLTTLKSLNADQRMLENGRSSKSGLRPGWMPPAKRDASLDAVQSLHLCSRPRFATPGQKVRWLTAPAVVLQITPILPSDRNAKSQFWPRPAILFVALVPAYRCYQRPALLNRTRISSSRVAACCKTKRCRSEEN